MANKQHLINGAAKATGDSIVAAGLFEPKGMAGKQMGGAALGSLGGSAVGGDLGSSIGVSAGVAVGTVAGAKDGGIRFVLAVSPTKIYVLKPEHFDSLHKEALELLQTYDRTSVEVTIHGRVSVRTIVLEDGSGQQVKLEGDRLWYRHTKSVLDEILSDHIEKEESVLEEA